MDHDGRGRPRRRRPCVTRPPERGSSAATSRNSLRRMAGSILGTAVRRVEDPDLLLGRAQFVDDLPIEGALHLAFVRSTYAHARITGVDTTDARAMPGVVAVYV